MIEVICGNDIESSLLTFRRLLNKDGIFSELVIRKYAMTRVQRRKVKDGIAARRRKREQIRWKKYSETTRRRYPTMMPWPKEEARREKHES